jgi:hypothetical protein
VPRRVPSPIAEEDLAQSSGLRSFR